MCIDLTSRLQSHNFCAQGSATLLELRVGHFGKGNLALDLIKPRRFPMAVRVQRERHHVACLHIRSVALEQWFLRRIRHFGHMLRVLGSLVTAQHGVCRQGDEEVSCLNLGQKEKGNKTPRLVTRVLSQTHPPCHCTTNFRCMCTRPAGASTSTTTP